MEKIKVCVLRSAGTNCDQETAAAFSRAEALPELVHINALIGRQKTLEHYQILALPGGFTYGDDLGAGKVFANELRFKLHEEIRQFIRDGKLVIGICNGFQILAKCGLLPSGQEMKQEVSLTINDSARFEDRWVYVRKAGSKCVWTKDLPEVIYLPVAHGEGKFVTKDKKTLERLKAGGQVAFRYCDASGISGGYPLNPNGSADDIAGICDDSGRVLGLMPHPERHSEFWQHPRWTKERLPEPHGFLIIRNGVEYARKNL